MKITNEEIKAINYAIDFLSSAAEAASEENAKPINKRISQLIKLLNKAKKQQN